MSAKGPGHAARLAVKGALGASLLFALGWARIATAVPTTYTQGTLSSISAPFTAGTAPTVKTAPVTLASIVFDTAPEITGEATQGGFFVVDGLLAGARNRMLFTGSLSQMVGPTFYAGTVPVLGRQELGLDPVTLTSWVSALDPDGTLDNTLGVVFGRVLDQAGAPVAGAAVTVTPAGGSIFYFDATGAPAVTATSTGPNGWFLVLNAPPANPSWAPGVENQPH